MRIFGTATAATEKTPRVTGPKKTEAYECCAATTELRRHRDAFAHDEPPAWIEHATSASRAVRKTQRT